MRIEIEVEEQVIREAVNSAWRASFSWDSSHGERGAGARAVHDEVAAAARAPEVLEIIREEVRRQMPRAITDAVSVAVALEIKRQVDAARRSGAIHHALQEPK